ncbi:MAG TPA: vitamin K epoxide reductase family protein [Candidatus Limnocylindrales bacterium]|nr:vitamin K epoxide reductase family protein [Candidatus Limnocylindrales bacterium]
MNTTSLAARWRALALLSAIFGAGVSVYLLVEYTTGQAGVCLTGSGCDEVRASQFAYPLGIPLPLFGVIFYAAAAWLAYRTLAGDRLLGVEPRAALLAAGLAGAAMSAVLTGLEAFVIGAFCTWCLASAAASVVLLGAALALVMTPEPEQPPGQSSRARQQRARAEESQRSGLRRLGAWGTTLTGLLFAGLLVAGAATGAPGPQQSGGNLAPAGSPRIGSGAVTVVEFSDFQCPGCAAVAPMLQSLAASGDITLVYRYFPLESIHANANASARAAEAAKRQGGFWTMDELLFARQSAWANLSASAADAYFASLAGEIGLDVDTWTADYGSQAVRDAVAFDAAAARDLRISSTPTVFIDGELYSGDLSLAGFRAAVAQAAARQTPGS